MLKKIICFAVLVYFCRMPALFSEDTMAGAVPERAEDAGTVIEEIRENETPRRFVSMEEGLSRKISLDLRGIDIVDAIKFLAMKGELNIVTSKSVSGRTTLFLCDVTISDTLDVILITNKLACEKKKNIITVMTEAEYEALYGQKYTDKREIRTLKLSYASASKVGAALSSIKSTIGAIITDDASGTVILIDTPEKISEMEKAVYEFDVGMEKKKVPTINRVFELEYAKVKDIEPKIKELLTENVGVLSTDERTNKIIVSDLPFAIERIEHIVENFDSKTRQVFIEARIVEISLSDKYTWGINWEKVFEDVHNFTLTGVFPAGDLASYGRIAIGTLSRDEYQATLTILQEVGDIKIVSAPHIAACNNEESKIMVGSREPYATSTISQSETTATTSWQAEFVDVGVTLTVTPTINKDGFIKMHIKPEVSTLRDWFEIEDDAGVAQIRLPIIDTTNAETDVLVKDGTTIIIAGLIKDIKRESSDKVPFLGDIPLLGYLFQSKATENTKSEAVIFITPHIISGDSNILYVNDTDKAKKPLKEISAGEEKDRGENIPKNAKPVKKKKH
ncbi:MAG: secretin N-terminal domain-containing protein [bacterium]|nr:secretin N-terminal domain-containing protein [bacterium]